MMFYWFLGGTGERQAHEVWPNPSSSSLAWYRGRRLVRFGSSLLAGLTAVMPLPAALKGPVRIESGLVSGVSGTNPAITAFKGIPFAAPPTGDLRWRPPQPPAPWSGIRPADRFSSDCTQPRTGAFGPWSAEYISKSGMEGGSSEDCLYLNVWTGAKTAREKRPVLVWLYGGGFSGGAASAPIYDGEGLATKGVVMVTFNYRLGVLGFLTHPELTRESGHNASGNYALLDMIAALRWVRENIAGFGGDPANVTIAGQSAGAFAVNFLMASPLAKGLFHRAIAQSGTALGGMAELKNVEHDGQRFAKLFGAASIAELRAKRAEELLKPPGGDGGVRFSTVVDGYALPKAVDAIFANGEQLQVPLLTGWNAGEGASDGPALNAKAFQEEAGRRLGARAGEFLKVFPAGNDREAAASMRAVERIQGGALTARTLARLQLKTGKSKVFLYYFDRVAPGSPEQTRYGAFHSGEIAYALNTLAMWHRPWEAADRKLADLMSSCWANFARTGDPNGKGVPVWPAYSMAAERSMYFGDRAEAVEIPDKAGLDFFDALRPGQQ